MNKKIKKMVETMEQYIGEDKTGYIIANILDAFEEMTKSGDVELRSFKLVFNNFFEKELIK